jgi:DnaJ-class molecular chaperone
MQIKTICEKCKGTREMLDPYGSGKQVRCDSCAGHGFQLTDDSKK